MRYQGQHYMFYRHIFITEYLKFLLRRKHRIIKRLAPVTFAALYLGASVDYLLYRILKIREVYFHLLYHLGNKPVLLGKQSIQKVCLHHLLVAVLHRNLLDVVQRLTALLCK